MVVMSWTKRRTCRQSASRQRKGQRGVPQVRCANVVHRHRQRRCFRSEAFESVACSLESRQDHVGIGLWRVCLEADDRRRPLGQSRLDHSSLSFASQMSVSFVRERIWRVHIESRQDQWAEGAVDGERGRVRRVRGYPHLADHAVVQLLSVRQMHSHARTPLLLIDLSRRLVDIRRPSW